MPALRPFDDVLAIYRALQPTRKLRSFEQDIHYDAVVAYSYLDLRKWPRNPPVPTLLRLKGGHGDKVLTSAKDLLDYAHFGYAIGTWNAKGHADFVCGEGYILADVELTQEQAGDDGGYGDSVSLLMAVWQLSDGWAGLVQRSGERELAARLIGLDGWPQEGWQRERVWYGE